MDREAILTKVNTDTSSSSTEVTQICQDKLDWVQDDICSRYDFSWLKDYGYINTIPSYTTGTVTATQDSATITGSSTVFTSAMVGRLFKVDGDENYYEISAYVSPTEITLSSTYTETTIAGADYDIYKTDYPLASDFKKMIWVKQLITPLRMVNIPELPFNIFYPDLFSRGSSYPDGYTLSGTDLSGLYTIRFTPVQIDRMQLYYQYIKDLPSINTLGATSKIPLKYHDAIVFMLDVFVFNLIDIPEKAKIYNNLYEQTIARMIDEDRKRDKSAGHSMANERLSSGSLSFVKFDPNHFDNY